MNTITFDNGKELEITEKEAMDLAEQIKNRVLWVNIWRDGILVFVIRIEKISFVS